MADAAKADAAKYGTFPEDKKDFAFEWESVADPWKLLISTGAAVGKTAGALLLIAWTLRSPKHLMPCNPYELSTAQVIGCEYTKAFLRAFPLLGVSVTLAIAMKLILYHRVYYGLLKNGGLLDFKNIVPYRDPLLICLAVSLVHAIGHFVLKLTDGQGIFLEEITSIGKNFIVPYVLFLVFVFDTNDVEKSLVPLSKYYEEDPEYARHALATVKYMEEDVVRFDVLSRDVVGAAIAEAPAIQATYHELIRGYDAAKAGYEAKEEDKSLVQVHLRESMWAGNILIDPRLQDEGSDSFRLMFQIFLVVSVVVQIVVFGLFLEQAILKDTMQDWWVEGSTYDLLSAFVLLVHAGVVVFILEATLWPVLYSAAEQEAENVKSTVKRVAAKATESPKSGPPRGAA